MIGTSLKKTKDQVLLMINSLIDIINNPKLVIKNSTYLYNSTYRNSFIIYLYVFKFIINDKDYLEKKYNEYVSMFPKKVYYPIFNITNMEYVKEIDLLLQIKDKISLESYSYDQNENKIYFEDNTYVDVKWFLTIVSILFGNTKNNENQEINICYTIPDKNIEKLKDKRNKEIFLSSFTYYSIKVKHVDKTKPVKDNHILIVKNTAINYLKHLKQYKHGLESEESYLIFYNLLKKECQKDGFELSEEEKNMLDIDYKELAKLEDLIDNNFCNHQLSKQIHFIENAVWQSSNDITLLEHMNVAVDHLIDFLTVIRVESYKTYEVLKREYYINDIQVLLILSALKFLLTYLDGDEKIDYSLLDLTFIEPKYMNSICEQPEAVLKNRLKNLNLELQAVKKNLDKYKKERSALNKDKLPPEKYQKELERCVGNINSASITIGRLNSKIASLHKEYEEERKISETKYRNVDVYNYNYSIIKHIYNSILGCSFYLKTNSSNLLNNIIIFEDYEKTENSFYLEISFKELLKISNQNVLNGIIDQIDLPKLA